MNHLIQFYLQQINQSLKDKTSFSTFCRIPKINSTEYFDCLIVCHNGNLSLSYGLSIEYNYWDMKNWVSKDKNVWHILGYLLNEENLRYAMSRNRLPYNWMYIVKTPDRKMVMMRRYGKNYLFVNEDVYISRNFVEWMYENQMNTKFNYELHHDGSYYIRV